MLRIITTRLKQKETLHVRHTRTGTANVSRAPSFTELLLHSESQDLLYGVYQNREIKGRTNRNSIVLLNKAWPTVRRLPRNLQLLSTLLWTVDIFWIALYLHTTRTRNVEKNWLKLHLRPYVNYALHCTGFNTTQKFATALYSDFPYQMSQKSANKV